MPGSKTLDRGVLGARLHAVGLHILDFHKYEQYLSLSLLAQD